MANIKPHKYINADYYSYFCETLEPTLRYFSIGMGIPHVDGHILSNTKWSLPPINEQTVIGQFLDHEIKKIDQLIAKQEQLIELLKEKRQAAISHAVTKGLNANVKMKDSGVEWLGEVPEHWRLKQIWHICSFMGGGTPSKANPSFWTGDIPWISPKDMKVSYISDAEDHISEDAVSFSSTKKYLLTQ